MPDMTPIDPTRDRATAGDATASDATSADASGNDDPRLVAAMREYMAALDAGQRVNRRELIARHPDIAGELSACLQGLAFVHAAAGQLTDGGVPLPPSVPDDARPPPTDELHVQPLGDYRLVREVGRGGMGVVYEAVQLSLGRRVAVKVLPMAAALDPRRLQRFRNEAQAAAGLHHTNIVPVYAVGSDRSTHFYAMQLIDGRSLAEVIRELRTTAAKRPPADRRPTDAPPRPAARPRSTRAGRPPPTRPGPCTGRHRRPPRRPPRPAGRRPSRRRPPGPARGRPTACRPSTAAAGASTSAPSPTSACRRRSRWTTPTTWASSTATSSRPT